MAIFENLYDLPSFDATAKTFNQLDSKVERFDSAGILLPRQLEYVAKEIRQQVFIDQTFLKTGIIVNNEGGYYDFITSLKDTVTGKFELEGRYGASNGEISIASSSDRTAVLQYSAKSRWTETERLQGVQEGRNVPARKIAAHNKIYTQMIDDFGYNGFDSNGGLFNNAQFASTSAVGAFSTLTGTQLYNEMKELFIVQWTLVNHTPELMANVIALPSDVLSILETTIYKDEAGITTVLDAIRKNMKVAEKEIIVVGTSKAGNDMVVFSNNPYAMKFRLPQRLKTFSPFVAHDETEVKTSFRIAGLEILEADCGYKLTGVKA